MMIKAIQQWYGEEDYEQGVELYLKHSSFPLFQTLFLSGKTSFTTSKLREELSKIDPPSASFTPPPSLQKASPSDEKIAYPVEVKALFKTRAEAFTLMKSATNDTDRFRLATAVRAKTKRIEHLLRVVDEQADALKGSDVDLLKKRSNNRSYISKFRDDPKKKLEVANRIKENFLIDQKLGE